MSTIVESNMEKEKYLIMPLFAYLHFEQLAFLNSHYELLKRNVNWPIAGSTSFVNGVEMHIINMAASANPMYRGGRCDP